MNDFHFLSCFIDTFLGCCVIEINSYADKQMQYDWAQWNFEISLSTNTTELRLICINATMKTKQPERFTSWVVICSGLLLQLGPTCMLVMSYAIYELLSY